VVSSQLLAFSKKTAEYYPLKAFRFTAVIVKYFLKLIAES